jgi:hypothetical protein
MDTVVLEVREDLTPLLTLQKENEKRIAALDSQINVAQAEKSRVTHQMESAIRLDKHEQKDTAAVREHYRILRLVSLYRWRILCCDPIHWLAYFLIGTALVTDVFLIVIMANGASPWWLVVIALVTLAGTAMSYLFLTCRLHETYGYGTTCAALWPWGCVGGCY